MAKRFLVPTVLALAVFGLPLTLPEQSLASSWETVVSKAREEGELTIITSWGADTRSAVMSLFKEKYGINVNVLAGGSRGSGRLLMERGARLYKTDLSLSGANRNVNVLKPAGALDPLEPTLMLPEVKDPAMWFRGQFPWFDRDRTMIAFFARLDSNLAINTDLVKPGEIKSYRDLLKPKWKGKILLTHPGRIGSGSGWFRENGKDLGLDFMHALAKQNPKILNDSRQSPEWLARGAYPVLIAGNGSTLVQFIQDGLPVAILDAEDSRRTMSPSSGMVTLINRAPHPNAAKLFINWILSKEGQTVMTLNEKLPSRRVDAPTSHLLPIMVPQPGKDYIEYTEESSDAGEEALRLARKIFGAQ